jgi:hypothetical protein
MTAVSQLMLTVTRLTSGLVEAAQEGFSDDVDSLMNEVQ